MKVLVTGAAGMLGRAVCQSLAGSHEVMAASRSELDVTDASALRRRLWRDRPECVVHLAALTDVDRCQREPEAAMAVNAAPVATIAEWCADEDAQLLLLSSIAVFDGTKTSPYIEIDTTRPANVYGLSKERAERLAVAVPRHLVVRTGWLFAGDESDHKFVGRILKTARERDFLEVVADSWGSPTWVVDLASGIRRLLDGGVQGLAHVVNAGEPASRVDLARAVMEAAGLRTLIRPVSSASFPGLAPRPAMEAARSLRTDGWLRPWPEAVRACLGARKEASS